MKPFYEEGGVTIYHGDCRDILPTMPGPADVVITDPVWPNAAPELEGSDRSWELFAEVMVMIPSITSRLVVQLGCDSDPRFLAGVPVALPFFRVCWLEYARPRYKGRLMYTGDVAYAFGQPPRSRPGARVIPGRFMSTVVDKDKKLRHPTPRKLEHVKWLVNWFAEGLVVDPLMGSGTTIRAAQEAGLPAIGIEISEEYCELAANRCRRQMVLTDSK